MCPYVAHAMRGGELMGDPDICSSCQTTLEGGAHDVKVRGLVVAVVCNVCELELELVER